MKIALHRYIAFLTFIFCNNINENIDLWIQQCFFTVHIWVKGPCTMKKVALTTCMFIANLDKHIFWDPIYYVYDVASTIEINFYWTQEMH